MILSDNDIRSKIEAGIDLVTPFCEENLQAASYDLTMSNTISVGINTGNVIDLSDDKAVKNAYRVISISEKGYVIKPGEYILALLNEYIYIPVNMCAHIRPRTRFTRIGLIVDAQHCNPGYGGKLSIGIQNVSSNTIQLVPELKIAQIVFEELNSIPSEEKQYHNKKDAIYNNETTIREASFSENELSPNARKFYDELRKDIFGDS